MTARGQELAIPAEFAGLAETPIMPGEDRQQFEALRWMIVDEVRPKTPLRWLLCLDLVDQSWEILRYRRLKQKILATRREIGIRAVLERIDGAGSEDPTRAYLECSRSAAAWRDDATTAIEIERRLGAAGYDAQAIDAEVLVQSDAAFLLLDRLMQTAQARRLVLLRELGVYR